MSDSCDPMDCSKPGFPVLHRLPEFAQTHVYLSIHLSLMEYYSALNNIMYIIYIYNIIWGFPGGSDGKESACNVGYLGLEDALEGGHGDPLLYSCLENPHGQRSLAGYSPWGLKELDMTE